MYISRLEGSDVSLIDESIIKQMIQDTSAEVVPMLIDHFIEETQSRIQRIMQAASDNDKSVLEFESHTLGSASLALGCRRLSNLARKIEHLCLDDKAAPAFALCPELNQLTQESIQALQERQQQGF